MEGRVCDAEIDGTSVGISLRLAGNELKNAKRGSKAKDIGWRMSTEKYFKRPGVLGPEKYGVLSKMIEISWLGANHGQEIPSELFTLR